MWKLDLTSMQWWKKPVSNYILNKCLKYFEDQQSSWIGNCWVGSCWIGSCCFIALCNDYGNNVIEVWMYNATNNKFILLVSNFSIKLRESMSFVAVNETTAIVFGGETFINNSNAAALNETWIMHLRPMLQWRQATRDTAYSVRPSARFNHAVVIMESKMYVFGGKDASKTCLNDLWVFDVTKERWSELRADNRGPNLSNASVCEYSAASTPGQLLVTVKYVYTPYASHSYKKD